MTDSSQIVSDAGPLIHLTELNCLDLLYDFKTLLIPREVWNEAIHHQPELTSHNITNANIIDIVSEPSARILALNDIFDLGIGEKAAIALMEITAAKMFLCDDAAARLAA